MKSSLMFRSLMILSLFVSGASIHNAQYRSLLENSKADQGSKLWRAFVEATVERCNGNDLCFVVRNAEVFVCQYR